MLLILIYFMVFKVSSASFDFQCQEKCTIDSLNSFFCINKNTITKFTSENLKSCYLEQYSNINALQYNFYLYNIVILGVYPLDLNYLSNFTQKIQILKWENGHLPIIHNLNNLKILKINFHSIYQLDKADFCPSSLEIIDLAYGNIFRVKNDFFVKFENLKEIDLQGNKIRTIGILEINSNFIRLIDFSSQTTNFMSSDLLSRKANSFSHFDGVFFHKDNSDPKLLVNFDSNYIDALPRILGKLRHIYYYKIGHQFDQAHLINRDFINLSDGPIVIENFEIYDQHFLINKVHTNFQCLLDYGVLKNVILSGKSKNKYLHHTIKKNFNFENCKKYVSTSTTTTTTLETTKNMTILSNKKTFIPTTTALGTSNKNTAKKINFISTIKSTVQSTKVPKFSSFEPEKNLQNTKSKEENKIGEKLMQKKEKSLRIRVLDYIIVNPGVVVSIFTFIFIFILILFAFFDYAIEKVKSKSIFYG
ncbi:unnamed protein product [Brachionus calyciflorus]|uniref:Uncharacterized protein n=1 Tax=Brachionus calyciflorus TaxID=104777 RepID=A0A813NK12_9BILA|nr:unnamed protein product [Brachionus calyciflorus]